MKYISEIFKDLASIDSFSERVKYIRRWSTPQLQKTLRYAFDKSLVRDVQEIPEYKEDDSPIGMSYNNTMTASRLYYMFFNGEMKDEGKRNRRLVGLLETTNKEEADIIKQVVLQNLNMKHLTEKLVRKAFPHLLTEKNNGTAEPESEAN
tara:strand:- start:372 stop:821 length:450 start_codon:yes stop_codon:yes gene_type:complete